MAQDPQSVILGLPPLKWRGIVAPPYDTAGYVVSQSQSERRYPFIDGASHDHVGRDPIPMNFKLYFINTLEENLFPDLFNRWQDAVAFDPKPGLLEHPMLGEALAVPISFTVDANARRSAGVTVDVSFMETIDTTDDSRRVLLGADVDIKSLSLAADASMADLNIPWPDGARVDSLFDLAKQIEGLAFSTRLQAQGMINQAVGFIDGLIDSVSKTASHVEWMHYGFLKDLRNKYDDLSEKLEADRATSKWVGSIDYSLNNVAALLGNTIADLMILNPGIIRSPVVAKGTPVTYYTE